MWIQGPHPAGKYTNINIFNKVLSKFLGPGERGVEADEGTADRGHPGKIKCPGNNVNPAENRGRDAEWTDEDLRNSLPGLATTHHDAW